MSNEARRGSARYLTRRRFTWGAAAAATATQATDAVGDEKESKPRPPSLSAKRPDGFVPMAAPGVVVKVEKSNCLQPNQLWPTEEAAKIMLERAMSELTGESDVGRAFARFVHRGDKVAVKLNGIAGQTGGLMGTNKELVLEIVRGILAAGIAPKDILVFEQYGSFLRGTRVSESVLPKGVKTATHNNKDAKAPQVRVHKIPTWFVRQLTDATAVVNVALIKDHSLCGYTGALKNMTHGCIVNPGSFHQNLMNPQIPLLYAQDAIKSRVRLNITDGYKVIYNGGPLNKDKKARVLHEAVYVSTDPVALDRVGWHIVDKWRRDRGLKSLRDSKREPAYINTAGDLGLGIADMNRIRLKEVRA